MRNCSYVMRVSRGPGTSMADISTKKTCRKAQVDWEKEPLIRAKVKSTSVACKQISWVSAGHCGEHTALMTETKPRALCNMDEECGVWHLR
eukprot:3660219-Rhodomonas_salina.1